MRVNGHEVTVYVSGSLQIEQHGIGSLTLDADMHLVSCCSIAAEHGDSYQIASDITYGNDRWVTQIRHPVILSCTWGISEHKFRVLMLGGVRVVFFSHALLMPLCMHFVFCSIFRIVVVSCALNVLSVHVLR